MAKAAHFGQTDKVVAVRNFVRCPLVVVFSPPVERPFLLFGCVAVSLAFTNKPVRHARAPHQQLTVQSSILRLSNGSRGSLCRER